MIAIAAYKLQCCAAALRCTAQEHRFKQHLAARSDLTSYRRFGYPRVCDLRSRGELFRAAGKLFSTLGTCGRPAAGLYAHTDCNNDNEKLLVQLGLPHCGLLRTFVVL